MSTACKFHSAENSRSSANQRKSYGIGNTSSDFPIVLQAKNINDVPVHNLNMENYCGKDSWLIEKYGDVNAASRSKLIKGTNQLLNKNSKLLSYYKH